MRDVEREKIFPMFFNSEGWGMRKGGKFRREGVVRLIRKEGKREWVPEWKRDTSNGGGKDVVILFLGVAEVLSLLTGVNTFAQTQ
jgi:hypothetical protein